MAFVGTQGSLPQFNVWGRPQLNLVHLTSVPPWKAEFNATLMAHRLFRQVALSNPGVYEIRNGTDTDPIYGMKDMGILFGLQHAPKGMSLRRMQMLQRAGVRSMAIAYESNTEYGDGFKCSGPLTTRGRKLIEWMAACGILLDISHASFRTTCEALSFIESEKLPMKPMASHSGCYVVYHHRRNVTEECLDMITRLDGYIGIPLITFLLAPSSRTDNIWEHFLLHLKHAIWSCGLNHVGIGSDSNHMDMTIAQAHDHFNAMLKMLKIEEKDAGWAPHFPDRPREIIEHGSTMFDIVMGRILDTGLHTNVANKVCGENFAAYLARALPA